MVMVVGDSDSHGLPGVAAFDNVKPFLEVEIEIFIMIVGAEPGFRVVEGGFVHAVAECCVKDVVCWRWRAEACVWVVELGKAGFAWVAEGVSEEVKRDSDSLEDIEEHYAVY